MAKLSSEVGRVKHGYKQPWFSGPGPLEGGRFEVKHQLLGLEDVIGRLKNTDTVLDVGCAEGLVSIAFAKAGAHAVDGVDFSEPSIRVARQIAKEAGADNKVRFIQGDLNHTQSIEVEPNYDIVVALAVLHKMRDPAGATSWALRKVCRQGLAVIRLPSKIISDRRSGFRPVDVVQLANNRGFELLRETVGYPGSTIQEHIDQPKWLGIFRRVR